MWRKVYGRRNVVVPLNPQSNTISYFRPHVYLEHLDAKALIHIPFSSREGEWSAGFRLRACETFYNWGDYVVIRSDGRWYYYHWNALELVQVASGNHDAIRTEFPGVNYVRVVADERVGALIINEALPVWLQLPERPRGGWVDIVGSYFTGDGLAGKAVQFERLEIRGR